GVHEHVDLLRIGGPDVARPVNSQRGEADTGAGEELAHDHEEVGLDGIDAVPADIGAVDAEEVSTKRTTSDGVADRGVANEPGWRADWRGGLERIPREERSDVGRREDVAEVTRGRDEAATLVAGEVDCPSVRRDECIDAVWVGHRVRRTWGKARGDTDAEAREHHPRAVAGRPRGGGAPEGGPPAGGAGG